MNDVELDIYKNISDIDYEFHKKRIHRVIYPAN